MRVIFPDLSVYIEKSKLEALNLPTLYINAGRTALTAHLIEELSTDGHHKVHVLLRPSQKDHEKRKSFRKAKRTYSLRTVLLYAVPPDVPTSDTRSIL